MNATKQEAVAKQPTIASLTMPTWHPSSHAGHAAHTGHPTHAAHAGHASAAAHLSGHLLEEGHDLGVALVLHDVPGVRHDVLERRSHFLPMENDSIAIKKSITVRSVLCLL